MPLFQHNMQCGNAWHMLICYISQFKPSFVIPLMCMLISWWSQIFDILWSPPISDSPLTLLALLAATILAQPPLCLLVLLEMRAMCNPGPNCECCAFRVKNNLCICLKDVLRNVTGSSLAHATPFHQVLLKTAPVVFPQSCWQMDKQ